MSQNMARNAFNSRFTATPRVVKKCAGTGHRTPDATLQTEAESQAGTARDGNSMIRRLVGVVAFAVCVALPWGAPAAAANSPAKGMRFQWHQEGSDCGAQCRRWISAAGDITADTPAEFEKFAGERDVKGATLVLESGGGSVLGALALGRTIRRLDITTTVGSTIELRPGKEGGSALTPHASCRSMCAFVLLAGARRFVPSEARVAVHQIWIGSKRDDATAVSYSAEELMLVQRDIGLLAKYTFEMGGGMDLLETALKIPPWEPLRLLTRDELRRTSLHTIEHLFDEPTPQPTTTSLLSEASSSALTISENGWAVAEKAGARLMARRHPLTVEGEHIGTFDVMVSCGDAADQYTVSYSERRSAASARRPARPLKLVTVQIGSEQTMLRVVSSDRNAKSTDLVTYARAQLPARMIKTLAESGRSITVTTQAADRAETIIRLGNTGVGKSLPELASSCGKSANERSAAIR